MARKRLLLFIFGGLAGGTLLTMACSALMNDWSYLSRWLNGLAAIALALALLFGKQWIMTKLGGILAETMDEGSDAASPTPGPSKDRST